MKIFNIVSTVTLFSSTFSWARDLKDSQVELEKQHKEFDFVVKYLEQQAKIQDKSIAELEKALARNQQAISGNTSEIGANYKQTKDNHANIKTNKVAIDQHALQIEANTAEIVSNMAAIEQNSVDIQQNKIDLDANSDAIAEILAGGDQWAGATIRKLEIFGQPLEDADIDFMWPSEEQFAEMSPDVKLQSFNFASNSDGQLTEVTVNLSNGQSSPVFQPLFNQFIGGGYPWDQTIEFTSNESIRSVKLTGYDDVSTNRIEFFGSQGALATYDPFNFVLPDNYSHEYILEDNEELIGVYGKGVRNQGDENWLTSFGFLVKVKQD